MKKLDYIREYENKYQVKWLEEKIFEIDSIDDENLSTTNSKYYSVSPVQYFSLYNQSLAIIKADFMAKYQRLKGKRVLLPLGFSYSNSFIKKSSDQLKNEIEEYGLPPIFPVQENKRRNYLEKRVTHQWDIMKSLGIPNQEVSKFVDNEYWYDYFSNYSIQTLKQLSVGVDWRRSFITTNTNKYYDSFIKWQFETLKSLGKIKYGKSYKIWSPLDHSVCSDQNREIGEGVIVQDFVLIKLLIVQDSTSSNIIKSINNNNSTNNNIYLVSATIRPELIYGITNCWILPNEIYGAYEMINGDIFICNQHSILNMSYQGLTSNRGEFKCLANFNGLDLIGIQVYTPSISINKTVYVLPILKQLNEKGTGISISTPSDLPFDYAAFQDLIKNDKYSSKYNIKDEHLQINIVSIIEIPSDTTNTIAIKSYLENNIKSHQDFKNIEKASEYCLIKDYYQGIMLVGEYLGEKVSNVKNKIKDQLYESGYAINYYEPYSNVISRSGNKCVASVVNYWYINYGDDDIEWKDKVLKQIEKMDFGNPEYKNRIKSSLETIGKWNFSVSFGYGSKNPWDDRFLIDSLSDSTLYSVFCTISHLLQGDIKGSKPGTANITSDKMNIQVWDYIILGKDYPLNCGISKETLNILKKEFQYWYPFDFIVSDSNENQNHLLFFIYTHIAIFDDSYKLSNNTHMFCLKDKRRAPDLNNLIKSFSADVTRMELANTTNDSYLESHVCQSLVLRNYKEIEWVEEIVSLLNQLNERPINNYQDTLFDTEMNRVIMETEKAYEASNFREALHFAFYQLENSRDYYKLISGYNSTPMNKSLIIRYINLRAVLLYPIAPHFSQKLLDLLYAYDNININNAKWPTISNSIDYKVLKKKLYLDTVISKFRKSLEWDQKLIYKRTASLNSKSRYRRIPYHILPKPNNAIIYYGLDHPIWYQDIIEYLNSIYTQTNNSISKDNDLILKDIKYQYQIYIPYLKQIMQFISNFKEELKIFGKSLFNFNLNEYQILSDNINIISKSLDINLIEIKIYNSNINNNNSNNKPKLLNPIIIYNFDNK